MFYLPTKRVDVAIWALLLWALSVADWATTWAVLAMGGVERNVLVEAWIAGPLGFWVKVVLVGFALVALTFYGWRWKPLQSALVVASAVHLAVVSYNLATFYILTFS